MKNSDPAGSEFLQIICKLSIGHEAARLHTCDFHFLFLQPLFFRSCFVYNKYRMFKIHTIISMGGVAINGTAK